MQYLSKQYTHFDIIFSMTPFKVNSEYSPAGDQPEVLESPKMPI